MFNLFARLFQKPAAKPAPFVWDIPTHKGFRAVVRFCNGNEIARTFPTLAQAQAWLANEKRERAAFVAGVKARWAGFRAGRMAYRIHNLETGRFAPVCEWRAA